MTSAAFFGYSAGVSTKHPWYIVHGVHAALMLEANVASAGRTLSSPRNLTTLLSWFSLIVCATGFAAVFGFAAVSVAA